MRMLLHWTLLALGAAYVCAMATEIRMSTVVKETLTLLSTYQSLLIGNETLMIPVPVHKNHHLCIEETFRGVDTLKAQIVQGEAMDNLFQNLYLIKKYIDLQKKKCGEERRGVKHFLDYLQEFLGVINTEWTMES
ncbi:interleukin-5 [Oryctolagus cuniculus]|uniref:Interleukin-5 n=1 Tax=Oryctolagus cuniculus TaxID=9986 RepID=G1SL79_RABIT|nr:interleukin-5 [Oryctolagus cuniculus]